MNPEKFKEMVSELKPLLELAAPVIKKWGPICKATPPVPAQEMELERICEEAGFPPELFET
jgi:hypothetical protein